VALSSDNFSHDAAHNLHNVQPASIERCGKREKTPTLPEQEITEHEDLLGAAKGMTLRTWLTSCLTRDALSSYWYCGLRMTKGCTACPVSSSAAPMAGTTKMSGNVVEDEWKMGAS